MAQNRLNAMDNGATAQQAMQQYPQQQQYGSQPQQNKTFVMVGRQALRNMANTLQQLAEFCIEMSNQQ